jgi:hypothetical protein
MYQMITPTYRLDADGFGELRCSGCATWQDADLEHFPADSRGRFGLSLTCRSCARKRSAAWRKANPKKASEERQRRCARERAAGNTKTKANPFAYWVHAKF